MAADVEEMEPVTEGDEDEQDNDPVDLADAELDDSGDDTEDYAEDGDGNDAEDAQDEEEEQQPRAKAKSKGGKSASKMMSEEGSVSLAEHLALVEKVRLLERDKYVAGVERILAGWEAGKLQFSEVNASRTKVPNPEGQQAKTTTGRSVRVVMSRPAQKQVRAVLLSEEYAALSEALQQQIAAAFEAIATGTVELGVRGGSHDTERQKTTKLAAARPETITAADGFNALPQTWAALEAEVRTLAEEQGVDYDELIAIKRGPVTPKLAEANATYDRLLRLADKRMREGA